MMGYTGIIGTHAQICNIHNDILDLCSLTMSSKLSLPGSFLTFQTSSEF